MILLYDYITTYSDKGLRVRINDRFGNKLYEGDMEYIKWEFMTRYIISHKYFPTGLLLIYLA